MSASAPRAVTAICQALQEQIEHGLLSSGCKLPAERKLSEVFDTTRITLREALVQLEARGLIYREERRGWFISPPRLDYDLVERSHFHAMVRAQGREPSTQLLSAQRVPAPAMVCDCLGLAPLSSVVRISRARRIDGRLVLYVEHHLHAQYFPDILEQDLSLPLTELYAQHYDIEYGRVRFEMAPTALYGDAAAALKVSEGSPGLRILRINEDRDGRVIDCDVEYWRHDAIRVQVEVG